MLKNRHKAARISLLACAILLSGAYAGAPGENKQIISPAVTPPTDLRPQPQDIQAANIETKTQTPVEATPDAKLDGFRINYEARISAFKADASLELSPSDQTNHYIYKVSTTARGLARLIKSGTVTEQSIFAFNGSGLQPARYDYDDGSGKAAKGSTVSFDWSRSIAHSVHEGVIADLELTPGLLDRLSADLQSILALRAGNTPGKQSIVYRNSIRHYELSLLGEETVTVPAGTFATLKFLRQRTGSKRATEIWFAKNAEYLPVKIVQLKNGELTASMAATSVTFSD